MSEQSASTKDGVSNAPLKGQKSEFDRGNNPSSLAGIKEARNTGEMKQGTKFLRDNMHGVGSSNKSE